MTKYSKKSQQNKKNNKYRKNVDNPWKLWYHNIRPRDKDKNKTRNERNDLKILDELRKISKKCGFVKK